MERQPLSGGAFYDDPDVFATYVRARARPISPNELMEEPTLREVVGPVDGLRILDLGCGDARFGLRLLQEGCRAYTGVDASTNMVRSAEQTLRGTSGRVHHQTIEALSMDPRGFDLVVSRLAFHYVENLAPVLARVHLLLVARGRLVFSVEHPVITSTDRGWDRSGPRQSWLVDDYFHTGRRDTQWLGARVLKYHRTVEDYVGLLQAGGFHLEALREACPRADMFPSSEEFVRRSRIPLFLVLAGVARPR